MEYAAEPRRVLQEKKVLTPWSGVHAGVPAGPNGGNHTGGGRRRRPTVSAASEREAGP